MSAIDLTGLDKADVLAALYNASRPLGMGFMHFDPKPMSREEAAALLEHGCQFDYLKGRVMKIDLSKTTLDPRLYDRDVGEGAAARAIAAMRDGDADSIDVMHRQGTQKSAALVMNRIQQETRTEIQDGCAVMRLGLADVREQLGPAVKRAKDVTS